MANPTRWATDTGPEHSQWYIDRFRKLAAEGADLAGEARLVDALVAPGSRILDAGSGTGRVGAALAERGHTVVGVDADPALVEAARADYPGPTWLVADLAELDLPALGEASRSTRRCWPATCSPSSPSAPNRRCCAGSPRTCDPTAC